MESRERKKLYIVIGLSAVFVAVGYFRFFHGKITFFSRPERSVAIPARIEIPAVDLKGLQPAGQSPKMAFEIPRAGLRDIFAPAKKMTTGTAAESPSVAAGPLKPLPTLQLTGTIIGGKRPLAIINGRFLRQGETIEGFQVLSIARNQVIMSGEGQKMVLNVLDGKEKEKGSGGR